MYKTVNVVVVTYGNRWVYLRGLLAFLEGEPSVRKVIVIDNASPYDVATACEQASFPKARVFRNDANLGSAGGFSRGISIACEEDNELILLLDDDNLPRPGSIKGLIDTYNGLAGETCDGKVAVIAYRDSQHARFRIPLKPLFMQGRDFLCFNVFNAFQRHLGLVKVENGPHSGPEYAVMSRGAAYSGMMFSPKLVSNIGLPNIDFILYFDDVEYAIRMLKMGHTIWLDRENPVDDVQLNYSASAYDIPFWGFLSADSDSKIYYNIRNRIYLDYFVDHKNSFPYMLNKFIFLSGITFLCLFTMKLRRLRTIFDAYRDGRGGRLGFKEGYQI
ncbi:glycosyltransferase [Geobacter sp.]|uniref:glycosyltransferase n=1 Tax=Geobacter sp. TaxID=46610 RepID=UPI0026278E78|nr:glycosyltransferase [Geobacter sp.]